MEGQTPPMTASEWQSQTRLPAPCRARSGASGATRSTILPEPLSHAGPDPTAEDEPVSDFLARAVSCWGSKEKPRGRLAW